jgi:DNA-binding transcriptional MerR regulator/methylmalonyl-CoA mutase cobalamin-binding subunit
MAATHHRPTYNLKVVVRETGLKPDTIRAWERRYGLPTPERSQGGHRLYSQQDIDTLKWLISRQAEGMSISRAVELWRQFEAEGEDPLQALVTPGVSDAALPLSPVQGDVLADLRERWVTACQDFDEQTAEQVIAQASAQFLPETVCLEILQKGLSEIGLHWYEGKVSVQQEHFSSALAMRRLQTMIAANPPPSRPGRIIVACPPEEDHTFSPLLITFLLKRRGWEVIYLGADVPADRLANTVAATDPHLAILSAQQLYTAARLLEIATLLSDLDIPVGYGGLVFNEQPALQTRIPGHFLGENLEQVPQAVEHLLASPAPAVVVEPPLAAYRRLLAAFRGKRSLIEARTWEALEPMGMPYAHVAEANLNMSRSVMAALSLGDVSLLGPDIEWVTGLLDNFGLPERLEHYDNSADMLRDYLAAYREAFSACIGEEVGWPVVEWLDRFVTIG